MCRSIGSVSWHEKYSQREWQAWEKIQEQASRQWKSYKTGGFGADVVDAEMGERIDLTIDSGCAACALPVGQRIRELGVKTPTLNFQNDDVQSLKFSIMDKLQKPSKVVAASNRIVLQPEDQGGSFLENVRSKRRKRIFERNGVYVLPCWVKGNSQKRLAPLDESRPVYPKAQSPVQRKVVPCVLMDSLGYGPGGRRVEARFSPGFAIRS